LCGSPCKSAGRCCRATEAVSAFIQPQLLALLCLMRNEDWTFREAEMCLGDHSELRQALGLKNGSDFTTLCQFLQRLDNQTIVRALG